MTQSQDIEPMESTMGTKHGAAAARYDFRDHLTVVELNQVVEAVKAGEMSARRAALLLSPDATEADVLAMAEMQALRRAA